MLIQRMQELIAAIDVQLEGVRLNVTKARKRKPRGDAALALAFVSNAAGSSNVESQFTLALRASPARTPALPVLGLSMVRSWFS